MKALNEATALAVIYANTKRKTRKENLITIAKAFGYLVKLYGSPSIVAERVDLSPEMIREFLLILKLPLQVQKLVSQRKIDSIDILREISAIKDPSKQIIAANEFISTPTKEVRDIKRLIKQEGMTVENAKKTVLNARPKDLNIFIIDFDNETYLALIKKAKELKVKPPELVRGIVKDWLKAQRNMKQ